MSCERSNLEEEVLEYVRPTSFQKDLMGRLYKAVKSSLEKCLSGKGLQARIELQGSYSKGTMLSDHWEMDVFVVFEGVDEGWVFKESLGILEECLSGFPRFSRYAEHPYLTVSLMGMEADIVPVVFARKPGGKGLGVGRTLLHTSYVKSRLSENPCLADEVRLLKSFMKGVGVYGAETGVSGFSGYMAELLIIRYGGFRRAIEAASKWVPPVRLDTDRHLTEGPPCEAKGVAPLEIPDPVDPSRNAAASVSLQSLSRFILAARAYLKSPGIEYFHFYRRARGVDGDDHYVVVECRGDYFLEPPENLGGKLRKLSKNLASYLEGLGFRVLWYSHATDESSVALLVCSLESPMLPEKELMRGPEVWREFEAILGFIGRRLAEGGSVYVGPDGRLYGYRYRRIRDARIAVARWLESVKKPAGTRDCRVIGCKGLASCLHGRSKRLLERLDTPTPAWIKSAYTRLRPPE